MIWGIIIFVITLAVDLATDYLLWLHKKPVNHFRGALLRLTGLIPSVLLMPGNWILAAGMEGFLYLILFNGLFGILIAKNFFYLGETSVFDRIMKAISPWGFIVGFIGFGLFLYFYIKPIL